MRRLRPFLMLLIMALGAFQIPSAHGKTNRNSRVRSSFLTELSRNNVKNEDLTPYRLWHRNDVE
jgi:hypothetical protein